MQIILTLAVFCAVFVLLWLNSEHGNYRTGRDPTQRHCTDCGQEQWQYSDAPLAGWDNQWWERCGDARDPACKCHKDVKTTHNH